MKSPIRAPLLLGEVKEANSLPRRFWALRARPGNLLWLSAPWGRVWKPRVRPSRPLWRGVGVCVGALPSRTLTHFNAGPGPCTPPNESMSSFVSLLSRYGTCCGCPANGRRARGATGAGGGVTNVRLCLRVMGHGGGRVGAIRGRGEGGRGRTGDGGARTRALGRSDSGRGMEVLNARRQGRRVTSQRRGRQRSSPAAPDREVHAELRPPIPSQSPDNPPLTLAQSLAPPPCPSPWHPPCDIPSGCCSFTGPWTVTRSTLRMLRRVAAFCRPLRPVLLLVSFPRSRSPVVGVLGLC